MRIKAHYYLTPGQLALERGGKIVWVGRIGAPIENAEYDTILVSDADYDAIKSQTVER